MDNSNKLDLSSKIMQFISSNNFKDVRTYYDEKKGLATITGEKDGIQYTTTMKEEKYGCIKTDTQFICDMDKSQKKEQVKSLLKQGFTQNQIANMLKISQSSVSKYKNEQDDID